MGPSAAARQARGPSAAARKAISNIHLFVSLQVSGKIVATTL